VTATWVLRPWGRRAVTAAGLSRSASVRRLGRVVAIALVVGGAAIGTWTGIEAAAAVPIASAGPVRLYRTANGLAIAMAFDHPRPLRDLADTFTFNGSATPGVGYAVMGEHGLVIGVRPHPERFEGWFAVTRAAFPPTGVYHVRMAKPTGQVRGRGTQGEAVFAVQTGTTKLTGLINYVVVASDSVHGATTWTVGYAHGHVADARLETLVRYPVPASSPPVRDLTLVTDGRHRLAVWFGDRLGFASDHLRLDIAPPFQPYLEVQARRIAYTSTFHDLWVTTGTALSVAAPSGSRLELVGAGGRLLAVATARHGTARLVPPPPLARGRGRLVVDLGGRRVVLGPFAYAGGDRLRLTGLTRPGRAGGRPTQRSPVGASTVGTI
jgi:hypothetical protein